MYQFPVTHYSAQPWRRFALLATVVALLLATVNLVGAGSASAASKPGRPSDVVGVGLNGAVALTWTAPSDGGSAITEYRLRYREAGTNTWSSAIRSKSGDPAYTVDGLSNGIAYQFKVRAFNSVGGSRWSAISSPVAPTGSVKEPSVQQPPAPSPEPTPDPTPDPTPEPTPDPTPDPTPNPTQDPTPDPDPSGWWAPVKGTSWQWQLSGTIDTSVDAAVFDIDGEGATAATVAAIHAKGAKAICYFDAGGWENYRTDANSFPESVKGNTVGGWPDEKWLDIRQLDILIPIMEKRVQDCANKGFDAIEPDLMDGFSNKTGFPLTYQDQLNYNRALADLGHKYGLGVALKNDPEQVKDLVNDFDFVIVEECAQYNECGEYKPFSDAGKAVLHVEYQGTLDSFCPTTKAMGFSSMKKKLNLNAYREVC